MNMSQVFRPLEETTRLSYDAAYLEAYDYDFEGPAIPENWSIRLDYAGWYAIEAENISELDPSEGYDRWQGLDSWWDDELSPEEE